MVVAVFVCRMTDPWSTSPGGMFEVGLRAYGKSVTGS